MESSRGVPVVQRVEERIRALIDSGAYQPDEKLPTEKELCGQLGVGRGTVREAFRLLQARGYVTMKPGRGAFVALGNQKDVTGAIDWLVENEHSLRDSLDVRAALEPMAAHRMAQQCTDEDVVRLSAIHQAFLEAIADGDSDRIGHFDEQFHSFIVEGSKNTLLIEINNHVRDGMELFRSKTFQVEQNVRNAILPHSRILQAVIMRDGALAEQEMRMHLEMVQSDLTKNIRISS